MIKHIHQLFHSFIHPQWKDLEGHFELTNNSLLKQAQELALQVKKIEETKELCEQRDKDVDFKLKGTEECYEEHQMREKQLGLYKKWIQEYDFKLNSKQEQLTIAQKEVEDCNGEISLKKEQLQLVQRIIEMCNVELGAKKKQLRCKICGKGKGKLISKFSCWRLETLLTSLFFSYLLSI